MYALLGVVVCTACSMFFSVAGYALRAFRRVQLEEALAGANRQQRIETLHAHLTALRLTVSFCRAAAHLMLVVFAVAMFSSWARGWAGLLAAAATAAAIIAFFGIAIPHAWASYAGEGFLARTLGLLLAVRYALYPIVAAMEALDVPIRRLSGVSDDDGENGESAKQEILQAATEGRADGAVDAEEVEMIESVMEFGETRAAEIMTPRTDVFALSDDASFAQAREKIVAAGHTRVPVYSGDLDNIIGILYAKDLLQQVDEAQPPPLRELMRKPFFVPETKLLDDLLREFKARKVHLAVVLDEYGGTAGLITVEDVIEEIVGDISDEYDSAAPALMRRVDDATAEVDGRLHIDDLNDAMGLAVPEDEDYDTVAGMVFSELGAIPTVGEKLHAYGAEFTVLGADERRITRLRVQVLPPGSGEGKA